jgi:hypothetical protein
VRTLIIIDGDPEDLGRAAAPIGPPAELELKRSSPYATMRRRDHESIDGHRCR